MFEKIFCKHDYKLIEAGIVHYPDYEPHKVAIITECYKCHKVKRKLYEPYYFIATYGRRAYEDVLEGRCKSL